MSKINIGSIQANNIIFINNGVVEVKTEAQYNAALKRIDEIFDVTSESKEYKELVALGEAVKKYEDKHYPID